MLTFKQFLFEQFLIVEERINKIKEIFKNKIDTSHDSLAQHKDSDDIIDHFATNADPTHNKAHTQWIVNRYRQGQFRQEDHPRIKKALSTFDRPAVKAGLKANKKPTDINQYKSLSDLEDAVEPHEKAISGKEEEKKIKSEGADLVHSDNGVTVHHIKTEEAACSYGAGTKWCTAGEEKNMFNEYNKEGPLFTIQHQGRKYQFHNKSRQFMDEKDNPVKFKDLHPDIQKSLANSDHPEIIKANVLHHNPHIDSRHIGPLLDDKQDVNVRKLAITHPNATPEHIDKALDDEIMIVKQKAISHRNVTPDNITKALKDENVFVREEAISHPKATSDHICKALKDKNMSVRYKAITHPNVEEKHIDKALGDKHPSVREAAISRPDANAGHIDRALKDDDVIVRHKAVLHPNATIDQLKKATNDKNQFVAMAAEKRLSERLSERQ